MNGLNGCWEPMNRQQRRRQKKSRKDTGFRPEQVLAEAVQHHQAGRLDEAETLYRQIIVVQPDHADALHLLGVIVFQGGNPDRAIALFRQSIALNPDFPVAYNNLGNALKDRRELADAIAAFRRAVALKPDYALAHSNLGAALQEFGKPDEAAEACRQALVLDSYYPEAHNNLGNALKDQGKAEDAAASFRIAIALKPEYPEAHHNLGAVFRDQGRLDEAVASYRTAIALDPGFAKAHHNLGAVFRDQGKPDQAIVCSRAAIALDPDYAEAFHNLGNALKDQRKPVEAIAAYRKAVSLKPDYPNAYNSLGIALKEQGEIREAESAFRWALEIAPNFTTAYRNLADIKTFRADDDDLAAMEALLPDLTEDDKKVMYLCFALAKAYEDVKGYDRSFEYLQRGNRIKRMLNPYDPSADINIMTRIAEVFDGPFLARDHGPGCESESPVFIVGMPRSGTSLVEQILASHSQVHGGGENQTLGRMVDPLNREAADGRIFPEMVAGFGPDDWRNMGQAYVDAAVRPEIPHTTDKMPSNFHYVGLIHLMAPNAKIIHCVRDAVDTCLSCYKLPFVMGHEFTDDLRDLGLYHRAYAGLMKHWHRVLPGKVLDVRYEDVVGNQTEETRRLLDFCGLPWEDACLAFHETDRPVYTASAAQVRQPIYTSAVRRWKRYEKHLGELLEALGPRA